MQEPLQAHAHTHTHTLPVCRKVAWRQTLSRWAITSMSVCTKHWGGAVICFNGRKPQLRDPRGTFFQMASTKKAIPCILPIPVATTLQERWVQSSINPTPCCREAAYICVHGTFCGDSVCLFKIRGECAPAKRWKVELLSALHHLPTVGHVITMIPMLTTARDSEMKQNIHRKR